MAKSRCEPLPPVQPSHGTIPLTCAMYSQKSQTYDSDFPATSTWTSNGVPHSWKIKNPTTMEPDGTQRKPSQAETVLNWQSENAVAQNKLLQKIEAQQQRLEEKIDRGFASFGSPIPELKKRISQLHEQILSLVQMRQDFSAQEREIKHLKVQLQSLEHQEQHPPSSVYPWSEPRSGPSPLLSLPKTTQAFKSVPDRQPGSSAFLFSSEEYAKRLKPLSGTPWSQPQQQRQDFPPYPTTRPQQSTVPPQSSSFQQNSRTDSCPLESSGPNQPFHMMQSSTDSNPIAAYLQHMEGHDPVTDQVPTFEESEPESSEGSSEQEESPQTLPAMHMTQPSTSTYQEPIVTEPEADPIDQDPPVREPQMAKQTTSFTNVAFTLDPYPPEEWKQRIHQMYTWSMIELLKPNTNLQDIYKSIIVRFMGMLHTWWHNLGEYRQIQMLNSETLETFFGYILHEFVGDTRNHVDKQREEFFKLKCCSVKPKDLQQHFKVLLSDFMRSMDKTIQMSNRHISTPYQSHLEERFSGSSSRITSNYRMSLLDSSINIFRKLSRSFAATGSS